MRRTSIAALAAIVIAVPSGAGAHSAVESRVCHRGTPAQIEDKSKCLQAGEYCALRDQRQYERYGYECSTRFGLRVCGGGSPRPILTRPA
jgi:hypothetical protein